jgi:hypothetical protein
MVNRLQDVACHVPEDRRNDERREDWIVAERIQDRGGDDEHRGDGETDSRTDEARVEVSRERIHAIHR